MNLWKGRFAGGMHPEALRFSTSLGVDGRLYREDIAGSLAHLAMLQKQKVVPAADARAIKKALIAVRRELDLAGGSNKRKQHKVKSTGRFLAEDVHMAIEGRVIEKIGPRGGKLHTGRSRNDQIALDERLYLRTTIVRVSALLTSLQRALVAKAEASQSILMPGYTHMQRAQPILLAHHLLAYVSMLDRDKDRFRDCLRRAALSPLGAGALAGTSFPLDRASVARQLGLKGIVENSIDAVSDRDALIEFISAAALTMMHLSRFAEELVLWSSQEWRFVEIGEAFTTGSSIMPQKRNPDMAELIRGKTGRVYGDLVALLTVMKGLPLSYNRDMQEDKEPLFDAADTVCASLSIMGLMVPTLTFAAERFERELESDFVIATDIADYLVRKGMPFRSAHSVVGAIVLSCQKRRISLQQMLLREYREFSPLFSEDLESVLSPWNSVKLKKTAGSTAPSEVKKEIGRWKKRIKAVGSRR